MPRGRLRDSAGGETTALRWTSRHLVLMRWYLDCASAYTLRSKYIFVKASARPRADRSTVHRHRISSTAMRSSAVPDASYALEPVLDFMRLLWSIEHGLQR